jgi:hypothetical protein
MKLFEPHTFVTTGPHVVPVTENERIKMWLLPGWSFPLYCPEDHDSIWLPDEDDRLRIEDEYPCLKRVCGKDPLGQFQAAFNFLSLCRRRTTVDPVRTTYGLKHDVESVTGIYVSEGSFIRAALLDGYTLRRADKSGSCNLNIDCDDHHYQIVNALSDAIRTIKWERFNHGREVLV